MQPEIVNQPIDATLIPEAAHKLAQRALREHERAEKNVMKAVEHTVKAGQALLKAYDLCEYAHWEAFLEMHFGETTKRDDGSRPMSARTARTYMQIARNWSRLIAEHPEGFSSQRQVIKALAAITQADKSDPNGASSAARSRSDVGVTAGGATDLAPLSQTEGKKKRARTGPVWRASGPFVNEALRLVTSVDATLEKLVDEGFPLESEAHKVHAAVERLKTMLHQEIDEAEARQAASESTFVIETCGAGVLPASKEQAARMHHNKEQAARMHHNKEQAGRLHHNSDDAAFVLKVESEGDHDD